jgi:hypothetical protein
VLIGCSLWRLLPLGLLFMPHVHTDITGYEEKMSLGILLQTSPCK